LEKVLTNYNKKLQGTSDDKQIKLAKVDIDNLSELSGKYNVQAVPTGKNLFFSD
jgi:thioredoxin-like negative regulator of GroEL